ncbi:unnamed protein product [Discosporangium mesarthrocarpum]
MGAAPSFAAQNALKQPLDASDLDSPEAALQEVRRVRWLLKVAKDPEGCDEWYVGGIEDGVRNGKGSAYYPNGDIYHGEWKDGQWHGRGDLTTMLGARYVGTFEKGMKHGTGESEGADGVRYSGGFNRGLRWGLGTLSKEGGMGSYRGGFRGGVPHGEGMTQWPGGHFTGQYVDGKEHGPGCVFDGKGLKVAEVECERGKIVGGMAVCRGSQGGGKGWRCKGRWVCQLRWLSGDQHRLAFVLHPCSP